MPCQEFATIAYKIPVHKWLAIKFAASAYAARRDQCHFAKQLSMNLAEQGPSSWPNRRRTGNKARLFASIRTRRRVRRSGANQLNKLMYCGWASICTGMLMAALQADMDFSLTVSPSLRLLQNPDDYQPLKALSKDLA